MKAKDIYIRYPSIISIDDPAGSVFPKFKGWPLVLTKSAYHELIKFDMTLEAVCRVLEEGFDCARSRREKGTIERCVRQGKKTLKVVASHIFQLFPFLACFLRDIKSLKIQGASKVRKAALQALKQSLQESKKTNLKEFRKELRHNMFLLLRSRPTEPGMRTALRFILKKSEETVELNDLKKTLIKACAEYEKSRATALNRIAEIGARMIPKKSVVLTHCHSHTVEAILIKAWQQKKLKAVYCTETRPRFQGRVTATNLTKAGIPVTMVVDSAVASMIPQADIDLFISGADAILADGSVVNKIGTLSHAINADNNNIPYFAATGSIKFDPLTVFGVQEKIEERDWKEVWAKKPAKLKIRNPAFDITPAYLVTEIITEKGGFSPETLAMIMYEELGLAYKREKELSLHYLLKK